MYPAPQYFLNALEGGIVPAGAGCILPRGAGLSGVVRAGEKAIAPVGMVPRNRALA